MSFQRGSVRYVNQILEVGPQSFYVGLPFMIASVACLMTAIFTKIPKNKSNKKAVQQKKTILYVFGALFALIWLFLWIPFFKYLSIRY